jgi:hypothetical protein
MQLMQMDPSRQEYYNSVMVLNLDQNFWSHSHAMVDSSLQSFLFTVLHGCPVHGLLPRQKSACACAGDGGFIVVSANSTVFQSDFYTLGSLYSQCTITSFADKSRAPLVSPNCILGQPNECCNYDSGSACYKRK